MSRFWFVPGAVLVALVMALPAPSGASAVQPINFIRGTVTGSGFTTSTPSSVAVGPDGRLYVADTNGRLQALTLNPTTKAVTAVQQITTDADIQEIFGIAFDPTDASSPAPIYISNTISGFGDELPALPGTYPGKVTKISGAGYATREDIITGLPVSNSGHETNGLAFAPDGKLYIAEGSTTNAGVVNPNPGLFQRAEVPLSGAILVADIHAPGGFDGNITYSPPNTYSDDVDQTSGDVIVYAPGMRNPYDLIWHSNGMLYGTDNGPNDTYGPGSASCTTALPTDAATLDELNLIEFGNYYGHPNRNRGRSDPRQCVYHANTEASSSGYTAAIEANLPASSDGLAEYTAGNFGGQMQGDLLYAAWVNSELHRVKLSADGRSVVSDTTLATGLTYALDVAVGGDGTIYVAEYGGNRVTFFRPGESAVTGITVTAVSPPGGPVGGGQQVTITGTNFTTSAETTANIGGASLTGLVVQNSTTLTGTTSGSISGTGTKSVTVNVNSIGSATLPNAYNYSSGGGTIPPVANAGPDIITPIAHIDHAHVTIDARASTDADGFIVSYLWTENGVTLSTNPVDSKQFTLGTHVVTLAVTDNDGFISTDEVRIVVTATPVNPDPYYCFDVDGDGAVTLTDVMLVANDYGKRYGDTGYSRLRDWNADRVINSDDVMGTLDDITSSCPLVDRQIRAATAGMEQYQNINTAIAAGYGQITPYISGQGRHMLLGGVAGLGQMDVNWDPYYPESLLYEPDASTPGGWRLGGAMYVVPYSLTSIPPDGFAGNDDAWHYHDNLCIWYNGNAVQEGVSQATCLARPQPVWIEKAGWLLHLWNYHLNPTGRFVEINNTLTQGPASSSAALQIDMDPAVAGIQGTRSLASGSFTVDVVASGVSDIGALNFDLKYDPAVLSAPTVLGGDSRDRNPNANQTFLESSGRAFSCTPPDPAGAIVAGSLHSARISCTSSGPQNGPEAPTPQTVASVSFNIVGPSSGSVLLLANTNIFNHTGSTELASCNPTVTVTASCSAATITTQGPPDADADGCSDASELGSNHLLGGDRDPANPWDFFDVPVPALPVAGTRNRAINLSDVSAVLSWIGTVNNGGPNANGNDYDNDTNGNGIEDGVEYDRSPSSTPGKLWRLGPPSGAVSLSDASAVLASVGDHC